MEWQSVCVVWIHPLEHSSEIIPYENLKKKNNIKTFLF